MAWRRTRGAGRYKALAGDRTFAATALIALITIAAIANVTPAGVLAEQHRRMAQPGSGHTSNK